MSGTTLAADFGLQNEDQVDHIDGVTTPDRLYDHRIIFLDRLDEQMVQTLAGAAAKSLVLVVPRGTDMSWCRLGFIEADMPREIYSAIASTLFDYDSRFVVREDAIAPDCRIHPTVSISAGVTIGPGCIIDEGVIILPNATIGPNCRIGARSLIKSGAVIGQPGFGGFKDSRGQMQHLPHLGGVIIEPDVEIGAMTTVASGTIHPTVIESQAKIDDRVHIAHNCRIGHQAQIVAHAEVSGSVVVGPGVWIGPNAAVREGLTIGAGAFLAMGAIVTKNVEPNAKVGGNPARQLPGA